MESSGMRESPGRTQDAARPGFDLTTAKLRRPAARPGIIPRWSLVDRLAQEDFPAIVSVVAPSGYGKTTLLAQWAERGGQAFAWVSLDKRDNDPKVLLSYVAAALDAVQPVGERVFEALAATTSSVPGSVVPRLGSAFWSMTTPVVLVLDDVHLLRNTVCRDALSVLADHVPPGSRLVFAGRDEPPLRTARLRAEGRILEIGMSQLALDEVEAAALLDAADLALKDDEVAALHQQTEGWAAGLYLAALYVREGGSLQGGEAFGGADRLVSQYMEEEFLALIPARHREFLTRTAVLERMCGPLCEAVLELPGSAATLAELARSNLLLVPLDRRGYWYRCHHLFRDMLLAELERLEPGLLPVLHRRAAAWFEANDFAAQARIQLIQVHLALADTAGAKALMRGIDEILKRRPDLGTQAGEARAVRARPPADRGQVSPSASSLTAAELRVLPVLATHLSFPEIGAELFLSPHTVKSQAMSIYRKLGVSSRHEAVTVSRELGLLEGVDAGLNAGRGLARPGIPARVTAGDAEEQARCG
jgi:LuxR family maltose regulon positive regulatory protein